MKVTLLFFKKNLLIWFEVNNVGSIPKFKFLNIFVFIIFSYFKILKSLPLSIFAWIEYLPSTNKKLFFLRITAYPADPVKLDIILSLSLFEYSEKNSSFFGTT